MKIVLKKAWLFRLLINLWPPFFFTGIRVMQLSNDFRNLQVQLKLRFWNQNAVGAHFGGSLYAMTDPFYMLMLMSQLGDKYIVWDKLADIDYIKPGKGKVTADFVLSQSLLDDIINKTQHFFFRRIAAVFDAASPQSYIYFCCFCLGKLSAKTD